ncbi:MAG: calcium-translocating P-type ATPase, PMCA-type, partial [Deltaproteobacteria bacterium]|nr:calcium-translocating P-type ATPase, PMCA-type [Deltaproteobacteria bacterium]
MKDNHDKITGLTTEQVNESRNELGDNTLPPPASRKWQEIFLGVASDKTIIILSIAAAISISISIYTNSAIYEGLGILIAVFIATVVGFISELRSSWAFQALLEKNSEIETKIIRDGEFHTISSDQLVVGDMVVLAAGDKIPADGKVVQTVNLSCDTSAITGESVHSTPEKDSSLFRGYSVITGEGIMEVEKVGFATEMGKIRDALSEAPDPTPLQERLTKLANKIGIVGTLAAIAIFLALFLRHFIMVGFSFTSLSLVQFVLNAFIVAITIVVVSVPEGLPLAVTLNLALNMRRMAKDNNLVRTLEASETLGSATVICSDKTGTLTLNRMRVSKLWTADQGVESAVSKCFVKPHDRLFTNLLTTNSTAFLEKKDGGKLDYVGSPTEGSMLLLLQEKDYNYLDIRESAEIIDRKAFSSERKMMSSLIEWDENSNMLLVKGAPERVMEKSTEVAIDLEGKTVELSQKEDEIRKILQESTSQGERVLALAYKKYSNDVQTIAEKDLVLFGLVIIKDPIRKEVAGAVEKCQEAGIAVKIVTGDNPLTAKSIGKELGLFSEGDLVLTGNEFAQKSDEEIIAILPRLKILARSKPDDKFRLVALLKQQGEVVAVTGDGTNDAPALKKADIGLSMGISGTEVAKEASDVVLLDDNFKSIVQGVVWGRNLQQNIKKFLQFQLTVNVAALTTAFVGALIGGRSPLTAVQLLWVNLIMDTLAAIALGLEPPHDEYLMAQKPRKRQAPLIDGKMWWMIIGMGLYTFAVLMVLLKYNFISA